MWRFLFHFLRHTQFWNEGANVSFNSPCYMWSSVCYMWTPQRIFSLVRLLQCKVGELRCTTAGEASPRVQPKKRVRSQERELQCVRPYCIDTFGTRTQAQIFNTLNVDNVYKLLTRLVIKINDRKYSQKTRLIYGKKRAASKLRWS